MSLALSPLELSALSSRCSPTFDAGVSKGTGIDFSLTCAQLNASALGGTQNQRRDHGLVIRVKTVEESASISGFDAHKHINGRKRHILVDTLGLPISIYVTPADAHDTRGARCLLAGLAPLVPRLTKIWADAAYRARN